MSAWSGIISCNSMLTSPAVACPVTLEPRVSGHDLVSGSAVTGRNRGVGLLS